MNEFRFECLLRYASLLNDLTRSNVHVYDEISEVVLELKKELNIKDSRCDEGEDPSKLSKFIEEGFNEWKLKNNK